jgi:hypothetical protein
VDHFCDFVSGAIAADQPGLSKIGASLSALSIPTVAEGAVLLKESFARRREAGVLRTIGWHLWDEARGAEEM